MRGLGMLFYLLVQALVLVTYWFMRVEVWADMVWWFILGSLCTVIWSIYAQLRMYRKIERMVRGDHAGVR